MRCLVCHNVLQPGSRAIKPMYCSNRCRQQASRWRSRTPIPESMTDLRRWARADGKKPLRLDGRNASSTAPTTWATYPEVMASRTGDGFGIMMGDGLAAYDFDHCFTATGKLSADVAAHVADIADPVLFMEVSRSGNGLHVFVKSTARSFRRGGVEFYSHARFIRMTGCPFRGLEAGRVEGRA